MNLIEQLGGYKNAKKFINGECSDGFDVQGLRDALLKHRSQHNIFEKGDYVKANDSQFGFNELFKIDDFFAGDDGISLAVLDDGDCYPLSWLAHATPKEIAQGYRDE